MKRTSEKLLSQLRGETAKARADLAALPDTASDSAELAGTVLVLRDALSSIRQARLRIEAAQQRPEAALPEHLRKVGA